ncbi:hypothetical protein J4448_06830 [Candidatus Woesearchaeota archaeon]|nr:hypothetical protein [Candidatus Woesearchaeota archaeon]
MSKIRKIDRMNFKIFSLAILLLSFADAYFLLKYEHFSQLFWFCNTALFLLAFGLFFRKSIVITGIFLVALVVQIPWVLDFLVQLFLGYKLFGLVSYMFDYGFNSLRFYVELDHLLIIPLSIYGIKKLGFHKHGWVFASIAAFIINTGAYTFSSLLDNVNCVFYSCFSDKITISSYPLVYMLTWTLLICILIYLLNKIIYKILKRKQKIKI